HTTEIYTLSLHDALPIWGRKMEAEKSGQKNLRGLRKIRGIVVRVDTNYQEFTQAAWRTHRVRAMNCILIRVHLCSFFQLPFLGRSEEHTSELQSLAYLVC